jgi:histone acetyltransferase (RNA polymerase elongator complex component)
MNPLIIPVFLPNLGCRQRCLFCNQRVTAEEVPSVPSVRNFIEDSIKALPSNGTSEKQIAFYGGSFTAIPKEDQIRYLEAAHPFLTSGWIDSIRISTRPDALEEGTLSVLKKYGVKTVEIGAQSMIDEVLFLSQRGHSVADILSATSRLKQCGFEVGIHLMIGLPGDTCNRFLETLDQVINLKPDFLRIHPTLVLKGSPLESLWRAGKYSPLTLEETVHWLKTGLLKLERSSICVARIGLQPTPELERNLLAGPYHSSLHQLVDSEIAFEMAKHLLQNNAGEVRPLFLCNPKEVSNLRGQRNGNIFKLREQFRLEEITIQIREDIPRGTLVLQNQKGKVSIHRRDLYYFDGTRHNPSRPPFSKGKGKYITPPFIKSVRLETEGDAGGL